jgi:glycosyltransferase involved in cell wall biosynthesis
VNQPLISVITPVYNGAATLEATMLSVFGQDWPRVEYILVDGGSKDGTLDLIAKYKGRVVWISEPDKGVYDAMNKGVGMASGEWVFFLGSDDRLEDSEVLTSIFSDLTNADYDLLYGDVTSPSYKGLYDGPFTFEKLLSRNISHQAIFYRRSLLARVGGYDLRFRMHADWELNIRIFKLPRVRTKYVGRHIADFGAEGLSAGHDTQLIREVLIPERLRLLQTSDTKGLRSWRTYDEWWRMLRNSGIRDETALGASVGDIPVPPGIKSIVRWQKRIPPRVLRVGAVSKFLMFLHYLLSSA